MEPFATSQEQSFNSEKLQLIQLLLNTENPSIIKKVKELLTISQYEPLTKQDILNRADESETAYKKGRTMSIDDLEDEAKNW